ncbi:MAG: transposase [Planctomycetes bacterium]|nr:transposase [Planctomycetota bacterium]
MDATAAEDAYTSEQVLVEPRFEQAQPNDLFVADRHYAVCRLFLWVHDRCAKFVIREHPPQWILQEFRKAKRIGRVETGVVWEQPVEVFDGKTGRRLKLRRVIVKLDEPTEKGETEIRLLTNLPARVRAKKIARLYRRRWTIERHFDLIKNALHGQVESLGQPRASIFARCMSRVACNALAVVQGALTTTHGEEETEKLSGYYLADEIAGNDRAVDALLPQRELDDLTTRDAKHFWSWCRSVARQIRPQAFYAHPRGPKRPPPKRASGKHRHHYSTHRLLKEDKQRC